MKTAYILTGRITPEGTLELDERAPLISADEWEQRKAAMDAAIDCLSDDEAARIVEIVEQEFERIDPDDWR